MVKFIFLQPLNRSIYYIVSVSEKSMLACSVNGDCKLAYKIEEIDFGRKVCMEIEQLSLGLEERLVTKENIFQLLSTLVRNIHLSCVGVLQVAAAKPDARYVCGKRAWEQLGRKVKPDAVPIEIYFPMLEGEQRFQLVKVYDFESTEGAPLHGSSPRRNFADRITQITGAVWELVPEAALQGKMEKGFYVGNSNTFCLAESISGEERERVILMLYTDYILDSKGAEDKLVRMAVRYVVWEYFGCKHMLVSALFGKLNRLPGEEKLAFIKQVRRLARCVIEDLTERVLDFNETAYVNALLVSEEPQEVRERFMRAAEAAGALGDERQEELVELAEKLGNCSRECLARLCRMRRERRLFSFPPVKIEGW